MVKGYIADQLLQYGIRNPRLFAISSLCALEEKQGKNVEKRSMVFYKTLGLLSLRNHLRPYDERFNACFCACSIWCVARAISF